MSFAAIQGAVAGALVRALLALPAPLLRLLGGRGRPDGLEPDAWLLARLGTITRGTAERTPAEARERFVVETAMITARLPLDVEVTEVQVAGRDARLFVPAGVPSPSPLLVYFHGGGWVVGSPATHDPACRLLADQARVRVLSVDYRKAPEHRFPAGVEDASAAFLWAVEHAAELGADPDAIAVGGDSAGGNLAAVVSRRARDAGGPLPAFQLLIYPATDFSRPRRPSHAEFGSDYLLTIERMDWFEDQYVPDAGDKHHPDASPLLAGDLSGLPPAHIATAVADPLRDEGEEYAAMLRASGVPATVQRHPHLHGFFSITASPSARRAISHVAGALQQGLAR